MGMKIEYAIDILGTSRNSSTLTAQRVNEWDFFQKGGLKEKYHKARLEETLWKSMDRMLDKHNVDTIRKTMQMHEDTFKHQTRELHRLYSVQKMLMEQLKKESKQNSHWSSMTSSADQINHSQLINCQHSTTQTSSGHNFHLQRLREDLIARERSGSCSGDNLRISRRFDLERPAEEDISTGFSTIDHEQAGPSSHMAFKSTKVSIGGCEEDTEVELSLSIGNCNRRKRSKSYQPQLGRSELILKEKELDSPASFKSDIGGDCSDPTTPMSSSSATVDQERKQPHWLFHGLKLK